MIITPGWRLHKMVNEVITGVVRGVIRKKLEDLVFELMNHPRDSGDISKYIDIAREYCFWDIVNGFELVDSEIGKIQREATVEKEKAKKERELKEKQFQDYLITHPDKLDGIEKGLKILKDEKNIRSGRLDLAAIDEKENNAGIELKARDYDSIDTHVKIEKYLFEDDSKKSRVFFVAPEIKPDLFFSLRELQEQGRVRFFEYDFDFENQKYCNFKEIKADDFEEPKDIPWGRKKRKKENNGWIRVTAAIGNDRAKPKKKHAEFQETGSAEVKIQADKPSDMSSYPHYYQVLARSLPNLQDKEKYLKAREITKAQFEGLERLAFTDELASALDNAKKNADWFIPADDLHKMGEGHTLEVPYVGKRSGDSWDKFKKGYSLVREYSKDMGSHIINCFMHIALDNPKFRESIALQGKDESEKLQNALTWLKREQKILSKRIKSAMYGEADIKHLREIINQFRKDMSEGRNGYDKEFNDKYYKSLEYMTSFVSEALASEFIKSKIARTEELMKLDKNLALSYLTFSPDKSKENVNLYLEYFLSNGKLELGDKIDKNSMLVPNAESGKVLVQVGSHLHNFVEEDNKLYQSILTYFIGKEAQKALEISRKQKEQLEALVESAALNRELSMYNEDGDFDEVHPRKIDLAKLQANKMNVITSRKQLREKQMLMKGIVELDETFREFTKVSNDTFHYMLGHLGKQNINDLGKYESTFYKILAFIDNGDEAKALRRSLDSMNEDAEKESKFQKDPFIKEFTKKYTRFARERAIEQFLDLKIKRTKALNEIDENLAQSYLEYFELPEEIKSKMGEIFEETDLTGIRIKPIIQKDTEFYQNLISQLKVGEEYSELERTAKKAPEVHTESEKIQTVEEQRPEILKTKIPHGYPISAVIPNKAYEALSPSIQGVVNEFVDKFLNNNKYSNEVRKKYSVTARESRWYNQDMSEEQVRDYFYNLVTEAGKENSKPKNNKNHNGNNGAGK